MCIIKSFAVEKIFALGCSDCWYYSCFVTMKCFSRQNLIIDFYYYSFQKRVMVYFYSYSQTDLLVYLLFGVSIRTWSTRAALTRIHDCHHSPGRPRRKKRKKNRFVFFWLIDKKTGISFFINDFVLCLTIMIYFYIFRSYLNWFLINLDRVVNVPVGNIFDVWASVPVLVVSVWSSCPTGILRAPRL